MRSYLRLGAAAAAIGLALTMAPLVLAQAPPQNKVKTDKDGIMLNMPGGAFSTVILVNGLFFSIPAASVGQMTVVTAL